MSLNRFINKDVILKLNSPEYGQDLTIKDQSALSPLLLSPNLSSIVDKSKLINEVHVYTFDGDYLGSVINNDIILESTSNNIFLDSKKVFDILNIKVGSYKLAFNFLLPVFGSPNFNDIESVYWPSVVKEISPERDEIKLIVNDQQRLSLHQFKDYVFNLSSEDLLNNLVINFGSNRINRILNVKFDPIDQNVFYIKLYNTVDESIEELSKAWFAIELMDPYIDTVILINEVKPLETNKLAGPNFRMDVDGYDSVATNLQNWNDLLGTNTPTAQKVIDSILSSSNSATLNIDYTDHSNHIFYSSAEERIENFVYKLGLIESYKQSAKELTYSSGSGSRITSQNISKYNTNISEIETQFDYFERWLYYQGAGSLFTHDLTGSQTTYPKFINDNQWCCYSVTSSQGLEWYSSSIDYAKDYDSQNHNSLWWSIPEHILMDDANSQYILFVQMIGQHFDMLYTYISAMTQIHSRDEHPDRGPSRNLLWYIAKNFGWELQNTRQLSDLWLYKLGTDSSGSAVSSSSFIIDSHENQSYQIWRRIVNNLPHLLKTKGTSRSVKALLSIYGIPQTLISIKEYGGPGLDVDNPIYIEDRFQYKLLAGSGSYVKTNRDLRSFAYNGWKGNALSHPSESLLSARDPDTIEFRFDTRKLGSSGSAVLFAFDTTSSLYHVSIVSPVTLGSNVMVSGSDKYGKILLEALGQGSGSYTKYLPLFDEDIWTLRIYKDPLQTGSIKTLNLDVARASDALYGRISHTDSISINISSSFFNTGSGVYYLGGVPSNTSARILSSSLHNLHSIDPYYGYIQSYKEYYTTYSSGTYIEHVQNPGSYHTDSISGSYYSLYKYFPLGLDQQRWDHDEYLYMSSSHPDQTITSSVMYFVNYSGSQDNQYETDQETFYIQVPSLGGNVLQSQKIRIEDSELLHELDPASYGEKSRYDLSGIDSNRLAIVFSITDQINRDIFNHMGFEKLDPWIADPELEFESEYTELSNRRKEYYQKYQRKNDINAFIRILSVYDYSFFDQVKQLTPGRADLIAGILIEPTILERPKVIISRRPSIEATQWESTIRYESTQSGEYPNYDANINYTSSLVVKNNYYTSSIITTSSICISNNYYTSSLQNTSSICISNNYYTSSICRIPSITGSRFLTREWCGTINTIDPYSGSYSTTESYIDTNKTKCGYFIRIFYYDVSNVVDRYQREWHLYHSRSLNKYSSSSLKPSSYQYDECSNSMKSRFIGAKLSGKDINIDSPDTIDGGPVVVVKESNPNSLIPFNTGVEGSLKIE